MQLVAYGAQDIYLTGNPQITFFKVVYRRHTNFSMEAIEQTWNGTSTSDGRCTATISRNGDLVYRMYLQVDATGNSTVDNPGATYITNVEVEIGGQRIDSHTGDWMETWAELTEPNTSGTVANQGVFATLFQLMSAMGGYNSNSGAVPAGIYTIPLQFWFCRNAGLALPLIALQYHEVKIILDHTISTSWTSINSHSLWADYIYLDTDERRRFAQVSHEYLIDQVQDQSWENTSKDLHFNHPVKELIWRKKGTSDGGNNKLDSSGNWLLKLNGQDRFAPRDAKYFTRVQIWEHHSGAGGLDSMTENINAGHFNDSIAVYSFALKPEEHH